MPDTDFPELLGEIATQNPELVTGALTFLPEEEEEPATDEAALLPDDGEHRTLELTSQQREFIEQELATSLLDHDAAYVQRWERYDDIQKAYNLIPDIDLAGIHPYAAKSCSEITKTDVDQNKARLASMMRGARPLVKVEAYDPEEPTDEGRARVAMAQALEEWYEAYSRDEMNLHAVLGMKILSATMLGTGVTYDRWEETTKNVTVYQQDKKVSKTEKVTTAKLSMRLIELRDLILWPITLTDWQEDYEFVGHRSEYSRMRFRAMCTRWNTPEEAKEKVMAYLDEGPSKEQEEKTLREGVQSGNSDTLDKTLRIAELWVRGQPHEDLDDGHYVFFFHEDSGTLLHWTHNPHHELTHPYWPFRYKRKLGMAFGEGTGDELIIVQSKLSTLDNLEIDSLKVNTNNLIVLREGSRLDHFRQNVFPGAVLISENPKEDIVSITLGGTLDTIYEARDQAYKQGSLATGSASVLGGHGDPTMKSGSDTGSTLALIQEAGRKFGDVDVSIRDDWSLEAMSHMEMVQQYAPNGIFYKKVGQEKAIAAQRIKFMPPRGRLRDQFKITAQAPSASSNREVMKQHLMILYNIAVQHVGLVNQLGTEVFAQENPAMINVLKRDTVIYLNKLLIKIHELHEVEGLSPDIPRLKAPSNDQETIGRLMQELEKHQQQIEQMQQKMAMQEWAKMGGAPPQEARPGGGANGGP